MAIDRTPVISTPEDVGHADKPHITHPGNGHHKPEAVHDEELTPEDVEAGNAHANADPYDGLPVDRGWAWVVLLGSLD